MTASILNSSAILQILVNELKLLVILTWPDLTSITKVALQFMDSPKMWVTVVRLIMLLLKSFSDYVNCIAGMKITFCFWQQNDPLNINL